MAIVKQSSTGHGSLKDIQILVNKNQDIIDYQIKQAFPDLSNENIWWLSPIENEGYSEYRDEDFIELVGLDKDEIKLNEFWPKGGPQWDALAKASGSKIILCEAKANIPEIVSPASSASAKSKSLINQSLERTKAYLGITNNIDWSGKFYQYTNRLA